MLSAFYFLGDVEQARGYLEQAIRRASAAGHPVLEATYSASLAIIAHGDQHYEEAVEICRHGRRIAERTGNPNALAWLLANEANSLTALRHPSGLPTAERGLAIASAAGVSEAMAGLMCQRAVATLLMRAGRRGEAAEQLLPGLQASRRRSAWMWLRQTLIYAAQLLALGETASVAAIVFGAVRSSSTAAGYIHHLAVVRRRLIDALGEERFEELVAVGEGMAPDQAARMAEEALAELISKGP